MPHDNRVTLCEPGIGDEREAKGFVERDRVRFVPDSDADVVYRLDFKHFADGTIATRCGVSGKRPGGRPRSGCPGRRNREVTSANGLCGCCGIGAIGLEVGEPRQFQGGDRFSTGLTPPRATSQNRVAGGRMVMKTAKTGRNDPCPCGSGKKYKQCCVGKAAEKTIFLTKWIAVIVGILGLLVAVGTVASFFTDDQRNDAPTGRVWSSEHGHWHDAR